MADDAAAAPVAAAAKPKSPAGKKVKKPNKDVDFSTLCVPNPMRLMDALEGGQAAGNTPRPSNIDSQFLDGMRMLGGKKFREADKCFKVAIEEASKAVKSPTATKADLSRMGFVCFGRGYLFVCIGEMKGAEQLYRKSLQFWSKVHGATSPKLVGLLSDTVILHRVQRNWPAAVQMLDVLDRCVKEDGNSGKMCMSQMLRAEMLTEKCSGDDATPGDEDKAATATAWATVGETALKVSEEGEDGEHKARALHAYANWLRTDAGKATDKGADDAAVSTMADEAACLADALGIELKK